MLLGEGRIGSVRITMIVGMGRMPLAGNGLN